MKRWAYWLALAGLVLAPIAATAQENESFETWEESQGREQPVGWRGSPFGVGKSEAAHGGKFAATVWNWYYYGRGYLFNGPGEPFWFELDRGGTPINWKPTSLTGYYRYNVDSNNSSKNTSGIVAVMLKRWNPQTQRPDTIGFAEQRLPPSPTFRQFTVSIRDYSPGIMPDSIVIGIISSDSGFCAVESSGNCCYLTVDDLRLSSTSGVDISVANLFPTVRIFPNPASDGRGSIAQWGTSSGGPFTLRIIATNGQIVRTIAAIEGTETMLHPQNLPAGNYLIEVRNSRGEAVGNGELLKK